MGYIQHVYIWQPTCTTSWYAFKQLCLRSFSVTACFKFVTSDKGPVFIEYPNTSLIRYLSVVEKIVN